MFFGVIPVDICELRMYLVSNEQRIHLYDTKKKTSNEDVLKNLNKTQINSRHLLKSKKPRSAHAKTSFANRIFYSVIQLSMV